MKIVTISEHTVDVVSFRGDLVHWGKDHFRSFPWRFTQDPYRLLMAEVMLHRTQASQVASVYASFVERYPDLNSLIHASHEDLHDILYSLGLRWRISLIMDMVRQLHQQFGDVVPQSKDDLLSLPGVSEYIASALRCFAWNLPDAIVDTNTVRVIGRVFGLEIKDSSRRNPLFRKLIAEFVDPVHPRLYNFALLDLAAQVCKKAQAPICNVCPVKQYCLYGRKIRTGPI